MGVWGKLRGLLAGQGEREAHITSPEELLADARMLRTGKGGVLVTNETAMRHSAVWACLRLRADLVSTMPVDAFRRVAGVQVEVPKPPVLVSPGGDQIGIKEWLYSSQIDLDRAGNVFGIVRERSGLIGADGRGLPAVIELANLADVTVKARGSQITDIYVGGQRYDLWDIWHERQYTVAGLPLGLSPVAFAAWSIEEGLNAQKFAREWFAGGAIPLAELTNTKRAITAEEAKVAKDVFRASVETGDLFVHGADWTYKPIQAVASQAAFLEARQYGVTDISRFFGVPSDLIDAAVSGQSVTYASMTERNLQFLVMNLGPAVSRREDALTRLLPGQRYVKLNRDALLSMSPEARARTIQTRITSRTLTPNEARALEDLPPLTEDQFAEFERLFPNRTQPTTATGVTK